MFITISYHALQLPMHQPTRYTCFLLIFQSYLNRLGQLDRYTTLYKTVKSDSASLDVSTRFFVFPAVQAGPGIRRFHLQDENDSEPLVQVGCWGVGVGLKHVHRLLNQRIRLLALRTLLGRFVAGRLFASVQLRHYGACWQCPVLLRWTAMRLLVAGR